MDCKRDVAQRVSQSVAANCCLNGTLDCPRSSRRTTNDHRILRGRRRRAGAGAKDFETNFEATSSVPPPPLPRSTSFLMRHRATNCSCRRSGRSNLGVRPASCPTSKRSRQSDLRLILNLQLSILPITLRSPVQSVCRQDWMGGRVTQATNDPFPSPPSAVVSGGRTRTSWHRNGIFCGDA